MATTVSQYRYEMEPGSDAPTYVSKVEVREDGFFVIDGDSLNMQGMPIGERRVAYLGDARGIITRPSPGVFSLYLECGTTGSESTPADITVTEFPAYPIWPSGETEAPQDIVTTNAASEPINLTQLKTAARHVHQKLSGLFRYLEDIKEHYPQADVQKAEDYIVYLHRGVRAVVSRGATTNLRLSGLTTLERLNFCYQLCIGSSDIIIDPSMTDEQRQRSIANQYFALTEADRVDGSENIATPTHAVVVVDPRNMKRVRLQDAIALSGSSPFRHQDEDSDVDGLELDTISYTGDIDGAWIEDITI